MKSTILIIFVIFSLADQYSKISEEIPAEVSPIENITALFEVTGFHNNFPQYSEDCCNLINIQCSRICKTKPARGKC